jgi:hypothetical protein
MNKANEKYLTNYRIEDEYSHTKDKYTICRQREDEKRI